MAQLAGWVKGLTASGGAAALVLTHSLEALARSLPLLAVVLLVLLFDRPAQRLNLLLRDRRLPPKRRSPRTPTGPASRPAPGNPTPARPVEQPKPPPDQLASYADLLRQHGLVELADQLERALGEGQPASDEPTARTRQGEPGPPR
jgi:hypothetical protein